MGGEKQQQRSRKELYTHTMRNINCVAVFSSPRLSSQRVCISILFLLLFVRFQFVCLQVASQRRELRVGRHKHSMQCCAEKKERKIRLMWNAREQENNNKNHQPHRTASLPLRYHLRRLCAVAVTLQGMLRGPVGSAASPLQCTAGLSAPSR